MICRCQPSEERPSWASSTSGDLSAVHGNGLGEAVPARYLPIGGTTGGAVCIRLTGSDAGAIYWANYDLANNILADGEASEDIMMRIAESWTQFLAHW